jgi:hypothetical protein
MIYYISIILIVILCFLLTKMYIKEGYINELNNPNQGIPNVPSDSLCMVLGLAGVNIDKYGILKNKCSFNSSQKQADTSNTCAT